MRHAEEMELPFRYQHPRSESSTRSVTFDRDTAFQGILRQRVAKYFDATGQRQRDCLQMYVKTAILLAGFSVSYVLLVFVARTWEQGVLLAVLLGLFATGIGFNIQHDGGHRAYSSRPWINRLMAMALDLMGGSSYLWRWKHGVFHHTYVNINGHDTDIDFGGLARLAPQQRWHAFHRWQHLYLWPLYGLLTIKWQCIGDFRSLLQGRIHQHPVPRPTGRELLIFIGGKAAFFALAFGIPLHFHSLAVVLGYYALSGIVMGFLLSVVFQMAHCVEEAEFPEPCASTGRLDHAWAVHQAETSVDFSRQSRVMSWLLGGLNFQIEHHLFPRISHVHYPAISKVVEQTSREFGIRYTVHDSLWAGIRSHFRWLRRMGMPNATGQPWTGPDLPTAVGGVPAHRDGLRDGGGVDDRRTAPEAKPTAHSQVR
jgi:linoleoyl-CoA desaturase